MLDRAAIEREIELIAIRAMTELRTTLAKPSSALTRWEIVKRADEQIIALRLKLMLDKED
jgi:hypothetical protein